MDARKLARIRQCEECEHRFTKHAKYAGPHGFAKFCAFWGYDNRRRVELHDAYMEGPNGNCPAGFWAALEGAETPVSAPVAPEQPIRPERKQLPHKGRIAALCVHGTQHGCCAVDCALKGETVRRKECLPSLCPDYEPKRT